MKSFSSLSVIFLFQLSFLCLTAVATKPATTLVVSRTETVENRKVGFLEKLPDGVKNGMASGLAAAVVKIILQPIDTIKTVQQATKVGMGPIQAMSTVVKRSGIQGLWSGVGITVLGSSPSVALYFGVYSSVKTHLTKLLPPDASQISRLLAVAVAASCGNTVASVLRAPYEVLKQRIQAGEHSSTLEAIRHSWRADGPLGLLTKGKLSSQIFRDVPYAIVTLVTYEVMQGLVKRAIVAREARLKVAGPSGTGSNRGVGRKPKALAGRNTAFSLQLLLDKLGGDRGAMDAFCGAAAGGLGSLLTTPMDVIKTRMMTGASGRYKSVLDAVRVMYREEGLGCFVIGTLPRLAHKVPANGLFFLCYEAFRSFLGVHEKETK